MKKVEYEMKRKKYRYRVNNVPNKRSQVKTSS